jgi:hypothetical protein
VNSNTRISSLYLVVYLKEYERTEEYRLQSRDYYHLISCSDFILSYTRMSKSTSEYPMLFKPLLVAGTIVVAFGVVCIWIGISVVLPREDGEGFKIIGIRFLIGGIVPITLAFIIKYFMLIRYILKQISYKGKSGDKFSDWYKP